MKLFNKGTRHIVHAESHKPGAACVPQKLFTVSDELGAKLKKMYPRELEGLEDAEMKFSDAPAAPAEKTPEELADIAEAMKYGVSLEELKELKKL